MKEKEHNIEIDTGNNDQEKGWRWEERRTKKGEKIE